MLTENYDFRTAYKLLSDPVEVLSLDLQGIMNGDVQLCNVLPPLRLAHVPIRTKGVCNAVICWFEVSHELRATRQFWASCLRPYYLEHRSTPLVTVGSRPGMEGRRRMRTHTLGSKLSSTGILCLLRR